MNHSTFSKTEICETICGKNNTLGFIEIIKFFNDFYVKKTHKK